MLKSYYNQCSFHNLSFNCLPTINNMKHYRNYVIMIIIAVIIIIIIKNYRNIHDIVLYIFEYLKILCKIYLKTHIVRIFPVFIE